MASITPNNRIRYNWRGNWSATTAYKAEDVVWFRGHTFICVAPHTSGTGTGSQDPLVDVMGDNKAGTTGSYWQTLSYSISSGYLANQYFTTYKANPGYYTTGYFGGVKIICTKLYQLGLLGKDVYEADQEFGKYLIESDPEVYEGYVAWAETVVDWMEGRVPHIPFLDRDRAQAWAIGSAMTIATPWAEHLAYKMGVLEADNRAGKFLMTVGRPISKAIGKWQRWFGKSSKPIGYFKMALMAAVFTALKLTVEAINSTGKEYVHDRKLNRQHS